MISTDGYRRIFYERFGSKDRENLESCSEYELINPWREDK